jgi:hypothetical protein
MVYGRDEVARGAVLGDRERGVTCRGLRPRIRAERLLQEAEEAALAEIAPEHRLRWTAARATAEVL